MVMYFNKNAKPSVSAIAFCLEGFIEDFWIFGVFRIIRGFGDFWILGTFWDFRYFLGF